MTYENTLLAARDAEILALQKYNALVRDTARGKETDGRDVLEILRLVEKSVEELEADVQWRIERDRQIAEIMQTEKLENEQKTLQAKVNKLYADFQQVEQKYHAEVYPLEAGIREIRERLTRTCSIRSDLLLDCRDENLNREMDDIRRLQYEKEKRVRGLTEATEQDRRELNHLEAVKRDRTISFSKMLRGDALSDEIKTLRAKIRKNEKEIGYLEADASELESRERDLKTRMMLA